MSEATSIRGDLALRRITCTVALLALALAPSAPSLAQQSADSSLVKLRSWTLAQSDLHPSRPAQDAHRMRLEMGFVNGSRWAPQVILDAAKHAVAILAQCDVRVTLVELHEFDAPPDYRQLRTRVSREFARRSGLAKPAVFFVDDTLHRPAFDAEAIGRGNARTRPEMADTVWITAGIRDLPIALAHELVHVLTDSGEHSDSPGNLMRDETAPGNTHLGPEQCSRIIAVGQANGLVESGTYYDTRR